MNPSDKTVKLFSIVQRQAGVSRRKAQDLVSAGEVCVDGVALHDPYRMLDSTTIDRISVRGHPLALEPPELRAYRFYKPTGMLCSHDDPHEGNTVGRILRAEGFIGYSWAGRLDIDAEGLLILTNDGALLNGLTHPRYQVIKTYHVWVDPLPPRSTVDRMLQGMQRGIVDAGDRLHIVSGRMSGRPPHVELQLIEGRKREIKRLFGHYGLHVVRLKRVAIGPIRVEGLQAGGIDRLTKNELEVLRSTGQASAAP